MWTVSLQKQAAVFTPQWLSTQERGCTIKSTCHYLFFHGVVLFARPLRCVPHTAMNDIKIQSHTQLPLLPLTWSCLSLCVSDCHCSDSCQHTAPGWWLRGPSSEPLPHGWAQRRLWRSACRIREREQHETERLGQCPRFLILLRTRKIKQREMAEKALNGADPGTKKIQQGSKLITLSPKLEKWTSSFSHPEAEVGWTPILAA